MFSIKIYDRLDNEQVNVLSSIIVVVIIAF